MGCSPTMRSWPARWAGVSFAASRVPQDGAAVVVEELDADVRLGVPAVVPVVAPGVVEPGLDGALEAVTEFATTIDQLARRIEDAIRVDEVEHAGVDSASG